MLIIFATHPVQYQVPLWRKMAEAGIAVEVWYFTDFGIEASYDKEFGKSFSWDLPMLEGYKYRFLRVNNDASPNKGFGGIVLKEDLKTLLKTQKVTHIYINGWQVAAYWQALWAAKSLNLKIIFKGESNDLRPENKWKWAFKKVLLKQFFAKIDYFLFIGEANKRLYKKHNIANEKLLPGLYCVDNDRFYEEAFKAISQKDNLREKWGIPKDAYCILFSGKFIPKKRPLDLISAVKMLKTNAKIHLLFVGDGELYREIAQTTNVVYDKDKGLINPVELNAINLSITGFLNQIEIPQIYAVADLLVLPSEYGETWGLVVNEAMATGLPAIVANQCGSAEDLAKPINPKLVYETGDIEGLSRAISTVIDYPIERSKILRHIQNYTYLSTINSIKTILSLEVAAIEK